MEEQKPLYKRINTIGNGALFPIKLSLSKQVTTEDEKGRSVNVNEPTFSWEITKGDPNLIKQNITAVLTHQIGERMREEVFGCRLWECLEEPSTNLQAYMIHKFVKDSVSAWEPRIKALSVDTTRRGTKVMINVRFQIELDSPVESIDFEYNINNQ